MELGKNINWIYLYNVASSHDEKWISRNNRRCWERWYDRQDPEHVSKPSRFIPKKIMTVRSTAGLIRYLALQSTIVQWNFHSRRRIRISEIFHNFDPNFDLWSFLKFISYSKLIFYEAVYEQILFFYFFICRIIILHNYEISFDLKP